MSVSNRDNYRVALYARVSTDDKGQDPETQLRELRANAEAWGWACIEYIDRASAGDLRGRREWRRLLEDARQHRFQLVMVWKLDRFARSSLDALQWLQQLDGYGIGFKILTQDIDTTTPAGRLVFTILAAVAEMERELITERVKAAIARAKAEGKPVGRQTGSKDKVKRKRSGYVARWERERVNKGGRQNGASTNSTRQAETATKGPQRNKPDKPAPERR